MSYPSDGVTYLEKIQKDKTVCSEIENAYYTLLRKWCRDHTTDEIRKQSVILRTVWRTRMDNNPFAAGPNEWVTQDVKRCPICQADYTDASYSLEVRYYDEQKMLHQVCPECMRRLGFTAPKTIIATRRWNNLWNELTNYRRQAGDINGGDW